MEKHKIIIIVLAALLIFSTLFVPPFIGRNDDGGVSQLISDNGMSYSGEISAQSLSYRLFVSDKTKGSFTPIIAAKKLCSVWGASFDLRMLALIYLPLFLAGLFLIISSIDVINKRAQIFVCIFAAIVLCDAAYVSFLNSFYYEALYLSALTLLFGSLMFMFGRESNSITALVLALLAVTIIASSGAFGAAVGILTAILFFTIGFWDKSKIRKPFTVATSLLIVAVSLSVLSVAPSIKGGDRDRYNALFSGALSGSEDVKADLDYFGIPERYADFAGKSYEEAGKEINFENGIVKEDLFSKITTTKIVKFYLLHPKRLYTVFNKAAKSAPSLSGDYLSSETEKNIPVIASPVWSRVHRFLMPASFPVLLALLLIITVLAALSMKKMPFFSKTVIFSALAACVLLAEPVISGGLKDISRRLVLFQFAYDMILIMCVNWIINAITLHRAKSR